MSKRRHFSRRDFLATALATATVPTVIGNVGRAAPKPKGLPEEDVTKITDAAPDKATAKPAKPRRLLVFNRCGGFRHGSIPWGSGAIEIMGNKAAAYETVVSDDMAVFTPDNLDPFDAMVFNNTTGLRFDELQRKALMDFVQGGKGVVGIHGATDNFYHWPEAAEMMGGLFSGHPWHEKVGIKIDDPGHPLVAGFGGKGFYITDEIYQFRDPYSRERLRVLLSLDMARTRKKGGREDEDFAVSWVRSLGEGRVFYCSLGHRNEIFWNPAILRHYLDGIQFALGDIAADTTPSAKLAKQPKPALCPEE